MPDNDYKPRFDDPRVGYFMTQVNDQSSKTSTPYRYLIHRWSLVKKDPNAAMSEPVEPITWWMENTTPKEIRPIIKKAGEQWNIAFEKAGFKNAVVIKQQPDDADWDAGDPYPWSDARVSAQAMRKTLKHLNQGRIFTSWINESGDDKRWCSVCRKKAVFEHESAPAASFCSSRCARLHLHLAQH